MRLDLKAEQFLAGGDLVREVVTALSSAFCCEIARSGNRRFRFALMTCHGSLCECVWAAGPAARGAVGQDPGATQPWLRAGHG